MKRNFAVNIAQLGRKFERHTLRVLGMRKISKQARLCLEVKRKNYARTNKPFEICASNRWNKCSTL
jgi:hypothetical protein